MIKDVERKIKRVVTSSDYLKGMQYDENSITLQSVDEKKDSNIYHFLIQSEQTYRFYRAEIGIKDNFVERTFCTCPQFITTHSCMHVAASLILYSDELFEDGRENRYLIQTKNFLKNYEGVRKNTIRKLLHLDIELEEVDSFTYALNIKIGLDHMYTLKNKLYDLKEAYYDESCEVVFGKFFTYSKREYYFSLEDEKLLEFLFEVEEERDSYYRYSFYFYGTLLKRLLNLLNGRSFLLNRELVTGIEKSSPITYSLKKREDSLYEFQYSKVTFLTSDYAYVLKDHVCYEIPASESRLLRKIEEEGLKEILFEEEDLAYFEKGILPIIKNHFVLDDSVTNLVITDKPKIKLYFDFDEMITCDFHLVYGDEEFSYFDKESSVLRDYEEESFVLEKLEGMGFVVVEESILLEDLDSIGDFFDSGIHVLSELFEVYTSTKMKQTKLLKNKGIMTNFGIGKDSIMSYQFSLTGAEKEEYKKIFDSLKKKKKYYRMKNGTLLNLENEEMKEFSSLVQEFDLNLEGGEIPKYRALYLDSLKTRYHSIHTNSQFEKFMKNFKNYQSLELSFGEDSILRDYQKIGVKWLYSIYKCDFGGILADEMGLGKSVQVIYFIKELMKEKKDARVLIVVPTSLVYNWKNEFDKFSSDISYQIVVGFKNLRKEMFQNLTTVTVTSYGLLREDIDFYKEQYFDAVMIDEAQTIKNVNAGITKAVKKVPSCVRFALTGTPIENSAMELYSIFDFIMPGFLGSATNFHSKYRIKEFDSDTEALLQNLNYLISPFILRRKKNDVMKELPDKIDNNIFIDLKEEQKKLYVAQVEKVKEEMDNLIQKEGFTKANFMILQLLTRLRQLCIDPKILFPDYEGGSSKIEELLKVVKELILNGHKILLFTSFKTALDIVREEFQKEGITSYQIDGSVPSKRRMNLVQQFNKDETNVFLIMLKSGGTGLNLTSADVVIHLDLWWNPQAENQATDRAHRIGQKKTVEVIRFIGKGTIEERILELQKKKKTLSDKIIEGDSREKNLLSSLTEEDIRHLLSYENAQ